MHINSLLQTIPNAVMIAHAGEIGIKSKSTRRNMIKQLHKNILNKINSADIDIKNIANRTILMHPSPHEIAKKISEVIFGVSYTAPIFLFEWDSYEKLTSVLIRFSINKLKSGNTFGFDAKSSGNDRISTTALKIELGSKLLLHFNNSISVDLNKPDYMFKIEVRSEKAWIYYERFEGLDGFPQGSQRNLVFGLLKPWYKDYLSSFQIMRRGVIVQPIRFLTDEGSNNLYDSIHNTFISEFSLKKSLDIPIYNILENFKTRFGEKICTACALFTELILAPVLENNTAGGYVTGFHLSQETGDITPSSLLWLESVTKIEKKHGISFRPCLINNKSIKSKSKLIINPNNSSCCNLVLKKRISFTLDSSEIILIKEEALRVSKRYFKDHKSK